MQVVICDICGNQIVHEQAPKKFDPRGRFNIEYAKAMADENGKITHYSYRGFHVCEKCDAVINDAIWKAIMPIAEEKKASVKVSNYAFPPEPEIEGHECCCEVACSW